MTKIQIIIDDGKSLQGLTCNRAEIITPTPSYEAISHFDFERAKEFSFIANDVIFDESPQLISIPDELLLRIRDYNIDTEHQNKLDEVNELLKKIEHLKNQVAGWEVRRDLAIEAVNEYEQILDEFIDRYPAVSAEAALRDGELDVACYFAEKANEEEQL